MGTIETLTAAVMTSPNLDALIENLNALGIACDDDENGRRPDELCDMTSLPTFGGEDIEIDGVYSWDTDRWLTVDVNGGWVIVPRR